ncbi:23 kDa integral membrane protein-like [Temnothorax curvispinosus]|uniref:Tetraspanin n=1 Tax=Temnothorax curvispinosus TaxID=300111 RepID=A0A6J1PGT3_9HYME|nr:23 kDa integral membrane protein-like [Temnothorax curvispinosus]
MGCGMGVIKYLLFIFNFIFVLCGLAILVLGVLAQVGNSDYSDHLGDISSNVTVPAVTFIVIGCIIFVIAFLGCCGAIRESHCMIVTFACLLLVILIVQVAIAIFAFVVAKNSGDYSWKDRYANDVFSKYGKGEETEIVDTIQSWLQCCGVEGPQDFPKIHHSAIPGSCCGKKESTCDPLSAYQKGCAGALEDIFKYSLTILGGVALGIAAAELIGIIFALCLANSIKNAQRRGYSV